LLDPSGGGGYPFTLAIIIVMASFCYRRNAEVKPPFSPEAVVDEFGSLVSPNIESDRRQYAGEWPREQFGKRGIEHRCADKPKRDLFRMPPMLNAGRITLPKSERREPALRPGTANGSVGKD
jgi:hypothetical protein